MFREGPQDDPRPILNQMFDQVLEITTYSAEVHGDGKFLGTGILRQNTMYSYSGPEIPRKNLRKVMGGARLIVGLKMLPQEEETRRRET